MTALGSRNSIRALGIGLAAYFATMVIVSVTLSGLIRLYFGLSGWDETEIRAFFARQFQAFPQVLLAGLPGILASAAAGYATARTVIELEYWHALGAALLAALIFTGPVIGRLPVWYTSLSLGLGLAAALLAASFPKAHKTLRSPAP
ncbi:MAG: hypothetical protein WBB04_08660 [Candidatus Macondimonas sp.]|jgi:hypothetical protein